MVLIQNASTQCAYLTINGDDAGVLQSGYSRCYALPSSGAAVITLRSDQKSYTKTDSAHLTVDTTYTLELKDDLRLIVTREKIGFAMHGYYDRFVLTAPDREILNTSYSVSNIEQVRKRLKRNHLLEIFIYDPLADLTLLSFFESFLEFGCAGSILLTLTVIVLSFVFSLWKYILLGFLGMWLLLGVFGWIADRTGKHLFKRTPLQDQSALDELSKWTDPAFIANYYAQPVRNPVIGTIEN